MRWLILFSSILLCGCSSVAPPVVDKTGIDPAKYAADEAQCVRDNTAIVTVGGPITRCMREKGYTILIPRS